MSVIKAAFGSWKTPITSDLIAQSAIRLLGVYHHDNQTFWMESRPQEAGRYVLVKQKSNGETVDINPKDAYMRTTVHEYGGDHLVFTGNNTLFYSNFKDQKVYKYQYNDENNQDGVAEPLTPEGFRYADGVFDKKRNKIVYVREDHTTGAKEPVNTITSVDIESGDQIVLASGADFYSSPRLSPDGSQLVYVQWNHPSMPWDNTELFLVSLDDSGNAIESTRTKIVGDNEAVCVPSYSPNGTLYFISDRGTGWWNIHRYVNQTVEKVFEKESEFTGPCWSFGLTPYGFLSDNEIITYYGEGLGKVGLINIENQTLTEYKSPYIFSPYDSIVLSDDKSKLLFTAGSPSEPTSVVEMDLKSGACVVLKKSIDIQIDSGYISVPETIEYPTTNMLTAYGYLYRPRNKDYAGLDDEKPPLLVKIHGGPTASTRAALRLDIQYWTSRGFAVFDSNYGGSTGYGREYRHRLYNGNWGIVDVDDCCNGAEYLVKIGVADAKKLCIDGGSAGGYTTLACLVFRDTFSAGASHYGVSDLEALAHDTHKFEARYLDNLVGPYPQEKQKYYDRSPIHFTDKLNKPLAIFQGDQDRIVPPSQADVMYKAVLNKGLPVMYLLFEGEQHGFRKAENIKKALDGELYFYSRVFGFQAADISALPIHNLQE